jgi:carbamoyltransferase
MYILGIHTGHDASASLFKDQELVAFCKEERMSRKKSDGKRTDLLAIDEVLEIAGINRSQIDVLAITRMRLPIESFKQLSKPFKSRWKAFWRKLKGEKTHVSLIDEMLAQGITDELDIIDTDALKRSMRLTNKTEVIFVNHHLAHVLGSFFSTEWREKALYLGCDGGGDCVRYSAYYYDDQSFSPIYGGEEAFTDPSLRQAGDIAIGNAYAIVTKLLGYKPIRHEGKITGLAAFGKPIHAKAIRDRFSIATGTGAITSKFNNGETLYSFLEGLNKNSSAEDMAASIQTATENFVSDWVKTLLKLYPAYYIGMSGGVFANVRLNQVIAEIDGLKELFIYPAMGDEGLSAGACIKVLIDKQGLDNLKRKKLQNTYLGRHYSAAELMDTAKRKGFQVIPKEDQALSTQTGQLLAQGKIGAIFNKSMEMGPRALGARSIIASPSARELNDTLNERLNRTEFMPFAPYVLDEDAREVFELNDCNWQAARFMTITTNVKKKYHDVIPAVVHVDGTARPQIIERDTNPLYYDILVAFKKETGIPCLVNTSFNAHEEPIINTPSEALVALKDNRIDFLVCEAGLVFNAGTSPK